MRARLTFNFSFNVSQSSIQMFMTTWNSPHNQLFQWILIKACLFDTKIFHSKWNAWHDVTIVLWQSLTWFFLSCPAPPSPCLALPTGMITGKPRSSSTLISTWRAWCWVSYYSQPNEGPTLPSFTRKDTWNKFSIVAPNEFGSMTNL